MKPSLIVLTTLALAGATALAQEGVTDKEVVLGIVVPMSGPAALTGIGAELGHRIAAAEVNAAGGINGRKVRIAVEDDGYVPSRAYQGLVKLNDGGVLGIVGTSGAASLAAMLPVLEEKRIPTIVNTSVSKAAVEPVRPHIFMIGASYQDLFFAEVKYIREHDKPSGPYALIRQDDDYGALVEDGFKRAVNDFKLPSVEVIRFKRGQKEFAAEILKLRSEKIGAIAIGGVIAEIPAVLKELAKLKMNIPVATPHTGNIAMASKLSAPYGMSYYAADYVATLQSDGAKNFRALANKYLSEDERANMNRFSITAYLGTKVMIKAAEECGKDVNRACVVGKIKAMRSFDTNGLTKPLDFSKPNNTAATAVQVVRVDPVKGTITDVTGFVDY